MGACGSKKSLVANPENTNSVVLETLASTPSPRVVIPGITIIDAPAVRVPAGLSCTVTTAGEREIYGNAAPIGTLNPADADAKIVPEESGPIKLALTTPSRVLTDDHTDVTYLFSHTMEQLQRVPPLKLVGLQCYGIVTNVIGGDIFDAVFSIPVSVLYTDSLDCPKENALVTIRVRMEGLDAPNPTTDKGIAAAEELRRQFATYNNFIFCKFSAKQDDAWGSHLATPYVGKGNGIDMCIHMRYYTCPRLGGLSAPYSPTKQPPNLWKGVVATSS